MTPPLNRRDALKAGSAAMAAFLAQTTAPGFAFPGESEDERLVPFLNMPRSRPHMLDWETLESWITPQDQVFSVQHYGVPEFDAKGHTLEITGLVEKPRTLSMDQLRDLPREERLMTLECSGNGASKGFMGAIYNSRWGGTPLKPLLESCGVKPEGKEVVFFGVDEKVEQIRDTKVLTPFGRSMSVADALDPNLLLAYERNGKPLEKRNGAPIRLIVPGWYGIANVKWLNRIEVRDSRYMGRFMARDYVTIRGERRDGKVVFIETSVSTMNLKSIIARITRGETTGGRIPTKAYGAVWGAAPPRAVRSGTREGDGGAARAPKNAAAGATRPRRTPIDRVEVRVDDGPWRKAVLDQEPRAEYCWTFFSIDLGKLKPGKHTVVSRAIDAEGNVQPTADDPEIALKKTYWEAYQQWPREIELEA